MRWRTLILWLALSSAAASQAARLVIVGAEAGPAYLATAQTIVAQFERQKLPGLEIVQLKVADLSTTTSSAATLFVTLGSDAALALAKADVRAPVLCVLLPKHSFERALLAAARKASVQFSALYLEQPLARQIELIRLALPAAKRIGVMSGPESREQVNALRPLLHAGGLQLVEAAIAREEAPYPGLQRILEESDVLLALPDPEIYNSNSIQNILLASFRARVPLVAFSPAYVRAGALMALYATTTQIGEQAASMARPVLQGKTLAATPQYLRDFSIDVNEHVARSLGLSLDAQSLAAQMRRREVAP